MVFAHFVVATLGERRTLPISAVEFLLKVYYHFVVEFVDGKESSFDFGHAFLAYLNVSLQ